MKMNLFDVVIEKFKTDVLQHLISDNFQIIDESKTNDSITEGNSADAANFAFGNNT